MMAVDGWLWVVQGHQRGQNDRLRGGPQLKSALTALRTVPSQRKDTEIWSTARRAMCESSRTACLYKLTKVYPDPYIIVLFVTLMSPDLFMHMSFLSLEKYLCHLVSDRCVTISYPLSLCRVNSSLSQIDRAFPKPYIIRLSLDKFGEHVFRVLIQTKVLIHTVYAFINYVDCNVIKIDL